MLRFIDDFLNGITMYRLMLYYLTFLLVIAAIFSAFSLLPFNFFSLAFSVLFLVTASGVTNKIFARVFNAPTNVESVYISALILALIITPLKSFAFSDIAFLFWAAVLSMASKYILAINKKHIFNPATFAAALTALTINQSASWWVGTPLMLPFVFLGGLLVVKKIRRFNLVWSFLFTALVAIFGFSVFRGTDMLAVTRQVILDSPIIFFAFVMLTEPLTTPPIKNLQIAYGAIVGLLFTPQIHIGSLYSTPELSLLIGNIFSYIVSPKEKLILQLKEKIKLSPDIYDLVFRLDKKFSFLPGQYMEWTLSHKNPDSRGNRRYFTIASSPTEESLHLGIKFYPNSSSWKKSLMAMDANSQIVASQVSGEFTLPKDPGKKLVFIAGGIGITPFRSMVKYLLDSNQKRDIVLLFSNKTTADIVYKDIFDEAYQKLGIKTVYVNTDTMGFIDAGFIQKEIPDYVERIFYISGPHGMVSVFEKVLKAMGLPSSQIKVDFFPGYA